MPETRELAEAHAWSRRRLAEVLLAGPVALRRAGPPTHGRALAGGVVLGLLLLGGFGVAALLRPQPPPDEPVTDLTSPGLLVVRRTGATYVVLADPGGPLVRPVLNPTSARLLLGPDVTPRLVGPAEEDTLAGLVARDRGPALGIPDAPPQLPGPADLVGRAWRACPDAGGVRLDLPADSPVPLGPGTATLVRASGRVALVVDAGDGARRRSLPADPVVAETLLSGIGAPPAAAAVPVPASWLDLLPAAPGELPPLAVRSDSTCLLLLAGPGRAPVVRLTTPPGPTGGPLPTGSAALVAPAADATTAPARLALVDDRGRLLRLAGDEVSERLGYAGTEPVRVPQPWLALLEPGPDLSVPAARGRAAR